MKSIVIIPNKHKDADLAVSTRAARFLADCGATVYVEEKYETDLGGSATVTPTIPQGAELIVVIGGDGSIIDASVPAVEYDLPVLGINLGNLGYLAEVEPDNIDQLKRIFTGEYKIEEKMLLSVDTVCEGANEASECLAVNDVVISHDNFLGICEFSLKNKNGDGVNYRADGVVIATPEGSTAYSLSAGGPIVSHGVGAMVVTPVCPHSFFNRSIIFNSDEKITVSNLGGTELNICTDGRFYKKLRCGESCTVYASEKRLKMLTFTKDNMFATLFKKMRILEDVK